MVLRCTHFLAGAVCVTDSAEIRSARAQVSYTVRIELRFASHLQITRVFVA
jgi:hypothetical protein